jgi:glycine/D-amino acid oxidase-like deaminating enzyme
LLYSVAVLEADKPGRGATGRNGGHCWPSHCEEQACPALGLLKLRTYELLSDAIRKHGIECEFRINGGVNLIHRDVDVAVEQQWIGQVMADQDLAAYRLEWWNESRVRALYPHLSLDNYGATYEPKVASLHPIKLLDGLWRAIAADPDAAARIHLYCNVFVAAVAPRDPATGLLRVDTSRGTVLAKKVVYATNAYSRILLPQLEHVVVPRRGQVIATDAQPDFPEHNFSCFEDDQYCDYMIKRVPTDGLVFGGARVHSKHPHKEDDRLDDDSIEPNVALALRQELRDIAGGAFHVTHEWTGCMAYTPDERALVGELPPQPRQAHAFGEHDNNKNIPPTPLKPTGSGEYVMAGWCGNGMASIFATSKEFVHSLITDEWSNIPPELNCARFIEPIDGSN